MSEIPTRVYIGRLPRGAEEKDVDKKFKEFGTIREITLKNGFAFVDYKDHRDAKDAVRDCHDQKFLGERIICEIAKGGRRNRDDFRDDRRDDRGRDDNRRKDNSRFGPTQRTKYRVIVENLDASTSWQDLKDYMRKVGEVSYADAHKKRVGEGVVEFSNYDDMKAVIRKLDETELKGRKIYLKEDKDSDRDRDRGRDSDRDSRRGRHRSRSHERRSRSLSRSRSPDAQRRRSRRDDDDDVEKDSKKKSSHRRRDDDEEEERKNRHSSTEDKSSRKTPPPKKEDEMNGKNAEKEDNEEFTQNESPMRDHELE